jgi:hypothetical protein
MANNGATKFDPSSREDGSRERPDLVLRGSRRDEKAASGWETTVLLFKGKNAGYLTGYVVANGEKHDVIGHINERKVDQATGEVKPNFITLSHLVGDGWQDLGHGNAINRRSDTKPVYFDEVLFNVKGEILSARVTDKVDSLLHRQLGFENQRVDRPARSHKPDGSKAEKSEPAPSPSLAARRAAASP